MLDDVSLDGQYVLYRQRGQGLLAKPLGEGTQANVVRKASRQPFSRRHFRTIRVSSLGSRYE